MMSKLKSQISNLKFKIKISKTFKLCVLVLIFEICSLNLAPKVFAAKARVWNTSTSTSATTTATRPSFSVKLRADRRALNINFNNINLSQSINYELTYVGNEIDQGVVGSVRQNEGSSAFRLLLFGTCSKSVCTYHRNITNAQLKITAKLLDGRTLIKKYTIKV